MKRLLLAAPLVLGACAPSASESRTDLGNTPSLPFQTGQVWRYTIRETGLQPITSEIKIEDVANPKLRGYVSRDENGQGGFTLSPEKNTELSYDPKSKSLYAILFHEGELYFCTIGNVADSKSWFEGKLVKGMSRIGPTIGTCGVSLK